METPELSMRMFPIENMMNVAGALVYNPEWYKPAGKDGVMLYLNANPDVQIVVDRIEAAGGRVVVPKTQISPEYGYMAVFLDTEGNRVALHSIPQ